MHRHTVADRRAVSLGGLHSSFIPLHRAGHGTPLVCIHGFLETWRVWELVLPALERHHDVLTPTLAGHAGGPRFDGDPSAEALVDALQRAMDEAGFKRAHLVGSSLGGYLALQLATRGRAETVVALAPAGGWAGDDDSPRELLAFQRELYLQAQAAVPHVDSILASSEGRRRATKLVVEKFEHIPVDLLAHRVLAAANCDAAARLIDSALQEGWSLEAGKIDCPVRVIWGAEDRLLPWPAAAARYRSEWLTHADWVVLDGVGHYPQLDVPLESSQLILGFTRYMA